jgi:hypothetical protein
VKRRENRELRIEDRGSRPEIAARSYDVELKSILRDGIMSDAEMENFLDRLSDKKRPLDEVRDFSFARQAWKELEQSK